MNSPTGFAADTIQNGVMQAAAAATGLSVGLPKINRTLLVLVVYVRGTPYGFVDSRDIGDAWSVSVLAARAHRTAMSGRVRDAPDRQGDDMFINAYYFRAHMYTIVPRQVREDMEWMADHGTNAVTIGVLEQDLFAAVRNMEIVQREAERVGMELHVTPSRWGGLVAGCPKVPSLFSAKNFDALVRNKDGSYLIGGFGPVASVHHPDTLAFFTGSLERLLDILPVAGIVWDEVKTLGIRDYSPAARKALEGKDLDDIRVHVDATAGFFDRVDKAALQMKPELRISMFLYGHLKGYEVERCAAIEHLHDFGCDGRPFRREDGGGSDSGAMPATKLLCDHGPYFVEQARANGKRGLFLIENHAMADADVPVMDKRLPEVLSLGAEHILYYYYPRSLEDPDHNMSVIGKHLGKVAKG